MVGTIHSLAFLWNEKDKKRKFANQNQNQEPPKLIEKLTEMKDELTAPVSPSEDLKRDTNTYHNLFRENIQTYLVVGRFSYPLLRQPL